MLESLWTWLEELPVAQHIAISWWFPFLESIHVLALVMVVGSIVGVDLRLLGWSGVGVRVTRMVRELIPWTWLAFVVAVATGGALFVTKANFYASNTAFQIKLVLLMLAGVNMTVFHWRTFRSVSSWDEGNSAPKSARIAGGLSLLLWIGIVTAGRWTGHL